jgi:hypothetical protein
MGPPLLGASVLCSFGNFKTELLQIVRVLSMLYALKILKSAYMSLKILFQTNQYFFDVTVLSYNFFSDDFLSPNKKIWNQHKNLLFDIKNVVVILMSTF